MPIALKTLAKKFSHEAPFGMSAYCGGGGGGGGGAPFHAARGGAGPEGVGRGRDRAGAGTGRVGPPRVLESAGAAFRRGVAVPPRRQDRGDREGLIDRRQAAT